VGSQDPRRLQFSDPRKTPPPGEIYTTMPSYSLGDIISSATAAIGRRADVLLSDASRLANDAYFEVFYASDSEEGETIAVSSTTLDENKIELPPDCWQPLSACLIYRPSWSTSSSVHSSYATLERIAFPEADGRNPEPAGTPTEIAFFNSWAELYPSPNSAYSFQLRYRAHPSDLTALTSTPRLSVAWRKAVELKTRENIANFVGAYDLEAKAASDYIRYVGTLKTAEAMRQRFETPNRVIPFKSQGGRRRV
jgi:hypothetical protein